MTITQEERVLVVEDEQKIGQLLKRQLADAGYHAMVATTGNQGLVLAAEQRPELVILDLRLPDMTGYEVCRALRQHYPSPVMPVIMLTASLQPVEQLRGFAYGADAYFTKPYDWDELLKAIELLLGKRTLA